MKNSQEEDLHRNYNDNWTPKYFYIFAAYMALVFITTNIISFKFIQIFGVKFGAGTLLFPATLIIGDLTTEVYGFARTRKIIILSMTCFLVYIFFTQLAMYLPAAPEWKDQAIFEQVFGQTPRFFVAGTLAYLSSELVNAYVMSRMKIMHKGKYFFLRAMVSSVAAELVNTSVFMGIAWAGKMGLLFLIGVALSGTGIKILLQALVLPLTSILATKLKAMEGVDHFDAKL